MGLVSYFKRKRQDSFNRKIITFFNQNTAAIELPSKANETFREAERKLWYEGMESEEFLKFYNTRFSVDSSQNTNKFYSNTVSQNADIAFMHYNLAQMISKTMGNLIFGKEPSIKVVSGNKETDKKKQLVLEDIFKDNDKMQLFVKAAELASYSGGAGFKVNIDKDVSEYPIIQVYPKEKIEVVKQYDRITDIIFKDYFPQPNDDDLVLYSIYGRGYIKYQLVKEEFNPAIGAVVIKKLSLSKLEETKDLKDCYFYNSDGTPSTRIMGVYVENKTNSKSDYDGAIDDFIGIDEVYSNFETFIRSSGIKLYVPEIMEEKDPNTGYIKNKNLDYSTKVTFIPTANFTWQATEIKRDIVEIKNNIDGYTNAMNSLIMRAINTAGLSPATMGYDIAGANSSGEALNIRERVSIRTREEKLVRWSDAIEKLSLILLSLSEVKVSDNMNYYIEDLKNFNINIDFPAYEHDYDAENQLLNSIITKYNAGFITLKDAVIQLNPGMEEKDIDNKVSELKREMETKSKLALKTSENTKSSMDLNIKKNN
nr:MAG TPA: portal protein [Caudoviricetes sp.]